MRLPSADIALETELCVARIGQKSAQGEVQRIDPSPPREMNSAMLSSEIFLLTNYQTINSVPTGRPSQMKVHITVTRNSFSVSTENLRSYTTLGTRTASEVSYNSRLFLRLCLVYDRSKFLVRLVAGGGVEPVGWR